MMGIAPYDGLSAELISVHVGESMIPKKPAPDLIRGV
jgi:hypothetical protein